MFWRKKKESVPWYRVPNYKGNLTEDEKRELDSFRHRAESHGEDHPAATYDDLPEEVRDYVSKLQIEFYDKIQEGLVGRCLLISAVGAFLLLNHFGWFTGAYNSTEILLVGALFLLAPWVYYPIKWRKNADRYLGDTNEDLRTQWELNYIVSNKRRKAP